MTTPKTGLTETANGQANYLNVNAALNALDQLVHQRVLDKDLATPPGSPANGNAYIVAGSPTGAWVGKTNQIAYWLTSAAAWSFLVPGANDRWIVRVSDENLDYRWSGSAWAVYSAQFAGTLSTALNEAPIVTLASAATVNIAAAAANTISISGTTTITAFDSIASGATRRLVFQGALTLTHNGASLILPTSASITTTAGDTAEFVSLGSGNWRCRSYQRANGDAVAFAYDRENILGTVSQSGGVPTGAIIERGNNANGEYVKFADGTLMCWFQPGLQAMTAGVDFVYSWTLPATATGIVGTGATADIAQAQTSNTFTTQKAHAWASSGAVVASRFRVDNTQNYLIALAFIGRWY